MYSGVSNISPIDYRGLYIGAKIIFSPPFSLSENYFSPPVILYANIYPHAPNFSVLWLLLHLFYPLNLNLLCYLSNSFFLRTYQPLFLRPYTFNNNATCRIGEERSMSIPWFWAQSSGQKRRRGIWPSFRQSRPRLELGWNLLTPETRGDYSSSF
jgi:hypothetical protein